MRWMVWKLPWRQKTDNKILKKFIISSSLPNYLCINGNRVQDIEEIVTIKRSGYGREFGKHGLTDFCELKSIAFQAK